MLNEKAEDPILASPTKRFFVDMLTRDIDLKDAVLDLLDNCVDGLMRSLGKNFEAKDQASPTKDSGRNCISQKTSSIFGIIAVALVANLPEKAPSG